MTDVAQSSNWSLKDEIKSYWSVRAETFDQAFGHRIPPGAEFDAWALELRERLGDDPLDVLELAAGTGEVTRVLLSLGHRVTGLDFSDAMLARARAKHGRNARFILADAEATMEPDGAYDAIVCRHLVWTLTAPEAALTDWFRVLRPGGHLIVFDGDFVNLPLRGRVAQQLIKLVDRWEKAAPPHRAPAMNVRHAEIMQQIPFADGLNFRQLATMSEEAGFIDTQFGGYGGIARAQRQGASLRNKLRTFLNSRFILHARKPGPDYRP